MKRDLLDPAWVRLSQIAIESLSESTRDHFQKFNKREGDWFEFSLGDLIMNFGNITHRGRGTPFIDNEVHFEKPY